MKNWTLRQRILIGFGVLFALLAGMGALDFMHLGNIQQEAVTVEKDPLPGLYHSSEMMEGEITGYSLVEEHVLQTDPAAMKSLEAGIKANRASIDSATEKYTAALASKAEKGQFETYQASLGSYKALVDQVLNLSTNAATKAEAVRTLNTRLAPQFQELRAALKTLLENNKGELEQSVQQIHHSVGAARTGILWIFGVALVVLLVFAYLLFVAISRPLVRLLKAMGSISTGDFTSRVNGLGRDEMGVIGDGLNRISDSMAQLIGQVQKSSFQVNSSATQMAATLKEQQTTANEVAATSVEVSVTAKEISATARELGQTMSGVATVADHTARLASDGQSDITKLENTMQRITGATGTISTKLGVLAEKTANINSVITTINKVADQTNLLSLNAAIEAEKAGEQGLGFAVVATEIRRLADQTAVATYDIEQMIREMQSAVASGVMAMDKFHEEIRLSGEVVRQVTGQLAEIIAQVQALTPRFESVNEGMQSQSTAAGQISEALSQLGDTTQLSAQAFQQNSEAIQILTAASSGLQEAVSLFKVKA